MQDNQKEEETDPLRETLVLEKGELDAEIDSKKVVIEDDLENPMEIEEESNPQIEEDLVEEDSFSEYEEESTQPSTVDQENNLPIRFPILQKLFAILKQDQVNDTLAGYF